MGAWHKASKPQRANDVVRSEILSCRQGTCGHTLCSVYSELTTRVVRLTSEFPVQALTQQQNRAVAALEN